MEWVLYSLEYKTKGEIETLEQKLKMALLNYFVFPIGMYGSYTLQHVLLQDIRTE